jgi:hypothetical protein
VFNNALACLSEEDRQLPALTRMLPLLQRGIAVHHSGLLPILKELIELLFQVGRGRRQGGGCCRGVTARVVCVRRGGGVAGRGGWRLWCVTESAMCGMFWCGAPRCVWCRATWCVCSPLSADTSS